MKAKPWLALLLSTSLLLGASLAALAKHVSDPENENMAVILGLSGESYPIIGTGGIRVRGGHHGFFSSNMKSSQIEIDGSGISSAGGITSPGGISSSPKLAPFNETSDFMAAANGAYFVSQSAVCRLPGAVGAAGQEIVVCNTGISGVTITYQVGNGENIVGAEQLGVLTVNRTTGKVDKFISDGKSWYRE